MFQSLKVVFIALVIIFAMEAKSARILYVFPLHFKSHHVVHQTLTQELARRGHEVTVITTHPAFKRGQTPENFIEIAIDVTDKLSNLTDFKVHSVTEAKYMFTDMLKLLTDADELMTQQLKYIKEALENYNVDHFDLIFLESGRRNILAISHIFNAPIIRISAIGPLDTDFLEVGAPTHPFLYPSMNQQKICNLTFWDKIVELSKYCNRELLRTPKLEQLETKQAKEIFGQDIPPIRELNNNVDMTFLQTHPLWEGNIPLPPSVIHIWGIHHKPASPLPTDIQVLMNSSTNGVIYMSFGSIMKASWLPNNTIQAIMKAVSRLPYDVFFKWEEEVLFEQPKNVYIRKWWPQSDLLRHSKVKVFVSHGGLMSVNEAIVAGVPVVNMPIFGDHFFNAEKCVHHKIGLKLDLEFVTEDQLFNAIITLIKDENYRRNIIKLRSLMMDQPQSALERAVWWTEHVLRHGGGKHLRAPAANLTWAQYYEIELVLAIVTILIFMFIVFISALFFCFSYLRKFCGRANSKALCKKCKVK